MDAMVKNPVIEVRNLVNRFGSHVVHQHLDLSVERDEILGLVGGSGAGKSVLLRSILGLHRFNEGGIGHTLLPIGRIRRNQPAG